MTRRNLPSRVDVGFAIAVVAVIAVRFAVLMEPSAPAGIDGGSWLMFGHALFGDAVRPETYVYPPMVPTLAAVTEAVFGPVVGLHLLGSVVAAAPAVGLYLALRRPSPWVAAIAALPLTLTTAVSDPASWGGYPQLLGFGLLPLLLAWVAAPWPRAGRRRLRHAGAGALAVAALLATSHIAAALAAISAAAVLTIRLLTDDDWRGAAYTALAGSAGAIAFLPLYLDFAPDAVSATAAPHGNTIHGLRGLGNAVRFVGRDAPDAWLLLSCLAVAAPAVLVFRRADRAWRVTVGLVVATAVLVIWTREVRFLYALPMAAAAAVALTIATAVADRPRPRGLALVVVVALVATAAFPVIGGLRHLDESRNRYTFIDSAAWQGILDTRRTLPRSARVAVASIRGAPVGWWVEGAARRQTLTASELQWLFYEPERQRARAAADVFASPFPTQASLDAAKAHGASHVAFDPRLTGDTELLKQLRREIPHRFVVDRAGWVVIAAEAV